jgi:predicted nucleic acid-binding protein
LALTDELPDGSSVAFDTNALIYYIEEHDKYLPLLVPVIDRVISNELRAHASVITFTEVLIHPLRMNSPDVAELYRELPSLGLAFHDLNVELADAAAELGAKYGLRTPDAIVCETAIRGGMRLPHYERSCIQAG